VAACERAVSALKSSIEGWGISSSSTSDRIIFAKLMPLEMEVDVEGRGEGIAAKGDEPAGFEKAAARSARACAASDAVGRELIVRWRS
jgi:hypothetical protein